MVLTTTHFPALPEPETICPSGTKMSCGKSSGMAGSYESPPSTASTSPSSPDKVAVEPSEEGGGAAGAVQPTSASDAAATSAIASGSRRWVGVDVSVVSSGMSNPRVVPTAELRGSHPSKLRRKALAMSINYPDVVAQVRQAPSTLCAPVLSQFA